MQALLEAAKLKGPLPDELKKLQDDYIEKRIKLDPLTYQETVEFLKKYKLDDYAEDLANLTLEREKKSALLCCCAPLWCLKWVRSKSIDGKV